MAQWKDNSGQAWDLLLDAPKIKGVREEFDGLDLVAMDGKAWARLDADIVLLVDVIWFLHRDQCESRDISESDFGKLLGVDGLENATAALEEAVGNFIPTRRRSVFQSMLKNYRAKMDAAEKEGIQMMESPEMEKQVRQMVRDQIQKAMDDHLTQ